VRKNRKGKADGNQSRTKEERRKVRVNSYMKCGWKKVEPPTKDEEKRRD